MKDDRLDTWLQERLGGLEFPVGDADWNDIRGKMKKRRGRVIPLSWYWAILPLVAVLAFSGGVWYNTAHRHAGGPATLQEIRDNSIARHNDIAAGDKSTEAKNTETARSRETKPWQDENFAYNSTMGRGDGHNANGRQIDAPTREGATATGNTNTYALPSADRNASGRYQNTDRKAMRNANGSAVPNRNKAGRGNDMLSATGSDSPRPAETDGRHGNIRNEDLRADLGTGNVNADFDKVQLAIARVPNGYTGLAGKKLKTPKDEEEWEGDKPAIYGNMRAAAPRLWISAAPYYFIPTLQLDTGVNLHGDYTATRNSLMKPSVSVSIQALSEWSVGSHVQLGTGLSYTKMTIVESGDYTIDRIPVIDSARNTIMGYIPRRAVPAQHVNASTSFTYINIPLSFGYPVWSMKQLSVQANANVQIRYMMASREQSTIDPLTLVSGDAPANIKYQRMGLGYGLSLRVSGPLTNKFSWMAEPGWQHSRQEFGISHNVGAIVQNSGLIRLGIGFKLN